MSQEEQTDEASGRDLLGLNGKIVDFLAEEGYRPHIDDDGDVVFKSEGYTMIVTLDDQDPALVRLYMLLRVDEDDESRMRALTACSAVSQHVKVAKAFWSEGRVVISAEVLAHRVEDALLPVFDRLIGALHAAEHIFREHYAAE